MKKDFEYFDFDIVKFSDAMQNSDLYGLEYIEKTIIRDFKDRLNDNIGADYTYYDYIINLFYATRELNECIFIHEQTRVENNFKADIYHETRDLLFKELGFDIEKIYEV